MRKRAGQGRIVLRNARRGADGPLCDVALDGERVGTVEEPGRLPVSAREVDLAGRLLLPGFVNGHDHLDFSTFPPLGRPPYASVYEWAADVEAGNGDPVVEQALAVPLHDRLFLGGVRNLLCGVTAVAHHGQYHRSLGRPGFPVRVLARYGFAHSPGLTRELRRTYRSSDRRIPWMVHAAEGTDERCAGELELLERANVLRANTLIIHGIGLRRADWPRIAAARACIVWCPESNRQLYGATAPIAGLRAAGVRTGLGSDSPVSGVRDPLSNLAAARREGVLSDSELLRLATSDTAEVARLPSGALTLGAPADLLATGSLESLLSGSRRAVALAVVAGRALYGEPELMRQLATPTAPLRVDGAERLMEAGLGRRCGSLLKAWPYLRRVPWIKELAPTAGTR